MSSMLQRTIGILLLFLFAGTARAGMDVPVLSVLNGASGQIKKDSIVMVQDAKFFDPSYENILIKPYLVRNMVSLEINEDALLMLQTNFNITVKLQISKTNASKAVTIEEKDFTIRYDKLGSYASRATYIFENAYKVEVKILSIDSGSTTGWNVSSVLKVVNQLQSFPKYVFSCDGNAVKQVFNDPSYTAGSTADEVKVWWAPQIGADEYDLEWAFVDIDALNDSLYGNPNNPDLNLVFANNASRITISGTTYSMPLFYDGKGKIFYRVRSVQWQDVMGPESGRIEANWSSQYTNGTGKLDFNGHEQGLNWQSSISFAEDGKRKGVMQYFDGSLKTRQTVTKDNVSNKTIVTESMYDYQGRPVIQTLPVPTLSNVINYTKYFNRAVGKSDYDKSLFDTLISSADYCGQTGLAMDVTSGASRYYSPFNDSANSINPIYRYIPDAEGYPFTEVVYLQDGTGRISRQSGVGKDFRIGSGHETRFYYGRPTQNELDALFGTEVGDMTHYFKNMVRDANGQLSVSYIDMHGRTIATALAGDTLATNLEALPSRNSFWVTDMLSDSGSNISNGLVMQSKMALTVEKEGVHKFRYELSPQVLKQEGCDTAKICYDCLYDLTITITDDCNNATLGGVPYVRSVKNFSLKSIDTSCANEKGFVDSVSLVLKPGVYQVTKRLALSQYAMDYYRDSVFMKKNNCKSIEDFVKEQRQIFLQSTQECEPTCSGCVDSLGTWEQFWARYRIKTGISNADTANYREAALTAYANALEDCNQLCATRNEYQELRNTMLSDMTPPSGQYASSDTARTYNIFGKDANAPYRTISGYRDGAGKLDSVFIAAGLLLPPQELNVPAFNDNFKESWAETLLQLHPEYCKLQKLDLIKASYEWDKRFEETDVYAIAKQRGYLNPTNNSSSPFSFFNGSGATDPDPLAGMLNSRFKTALENALIAFKIMDNNSYSMWGVAAATALCPTTTSACLLKYREGPALDTAIEVCDADRNMAWVNFRALYLQAKKTIINDWLNSECTAIPASALLLLGYQPRFASVQEMLGQGGITLPNNETEAQGIKTDAEQKIQGTYDANCRAYISHWLTQLSNCKLYSKNDLDSVIIPQLVQVCKEGSDLNHPMGSSSVKPGSTNPFKTFEEVIDNFNRLNNIIAPDCNGYGIVSPAPYDKQFVYNQKPLISRPADCECELINKYYYKYQAVKYNYTSFSDYMNRSWQTKISDTALSKLMGLCDGTYSCNFTEETLVLPASFQCNTGEVCIDCDMFKTADSSFRTRYPGMFPSGDLSTRDSTQKSWNTLYENFMNYKLGFNKTATEYLDFAWQCEGKWRSPGCDSLNRILADYKLNSQPDCLNAFTSFLNNRLGTSYNIGQIEQLYYSQCGRALDVCGNLDTLNATLKRFNLTKPTRSLVSLQSAGLSAPDSLITDPSRLYKDGALQWPASIQVRTESTSTHAKINTSGVELCTSRGFGAEARFKILGSPSSGNTTNIFSFTNANVKFVLGLGVQGLSLNEVWMFNNSNIWVNALGTPVMLNMNTNGGLNEWHNYRITVKSDSIRFYYDGVVKSILPNLKGSLINSTEFDYSVLGYNGQFDWIKINDQTGDPIYRENFSDPVVTAEFRPDFICSAMPVCQINFVNYFNQQRGTSYNFQKIDSVYFAYTGKSLNVCGSLDTLENTIGRYNATTGALRLRAIQFVNNDPTFDNSPYRYHEVPEYGIADGIFRWPDTLRNGNYGRGWRLFSFGPAQNAFCTDQGYSIEAKVHILKDIFSTAEELMIIKDANHEMVVGRHIADPLVSPLTYGTTIGKLLSFSSSNAAVSMDPNYTRLDPDPKVFFNNWVTIKVTVTPTRYRVYWNGVIKLDKARVPGHPLRQLGLFSILFFSFDGAIDWVKVYDHRGVERVYENFEDRDRRAIIPASFICPKPVSPCQVPFAAYYNQQRGTNYTYARIDSIYYAMTGKYLNICGSEPDPTLGKKLCGRSKELFSPVDFRSDDINNCTDSTYFITSKSHELYRIYQDSLKGKFDSSYRAKCLEAYKFEKFTVRHEVAEYHYTLYYYDQAGNLLKTIPPAGVHPNYDSVWLANVRTARAAKTVLVPSHTLPTDYRYNTLNQVVAQKSPDGGLSQFWYDRLGRLVLSQNAKQFHAAATEENRQYSYTKYDEIGRISEVGQLKNLASNGAMLDTITRTPSLLNTWMTALNQRREQVTSTIYDLPYGGFVGVVDNRQLIFQRNLRNRVSYTTYTNGWNTANYNQGTFYTYDIHGNVDTLLQDYGCGTCGAPEVYNVMNQNGNRFKKISYNFDLISGKVNSVAYQQGWNDQFFHKYSYDGENRLTLVETSLDGYVWEKDARYQYYLHGPLARTVLGNQQVQGIDYAYTLQGWLKGVNSAGATDSFDIGGDGKILSSNRFVARDAYGFVLNYFVNEYKPINPNAAAFPNYSSYLNTDARPLYNGNISSMVSTNRIFENPVLYPDSSTLLFNYTYDQLNRITGMEVFNKFNRLQNKYDNLAKLTGKFRERVSYDANGNILTYLRNTNGADPAMDDLTYHYYAGTNKLKRVTDIVPANKVGNNPGDKIIDIDNQEDEENYVYDSIGNLIQDKAEKITNINWNVYGKIVGISRTAGTHVPESEIGYTYDAGGNRIGKSVTKNDSAYHTWYVRDAQGNVMATYTSSKGSSNNLPAFELEESERYLYGSSRLGVVNVAQNVDNANGGPIEATINKVDTFWRGLRAYELSNHLGNVLVTISDRKKGVADPLNAALIKFFEPVMLSGTDYYPFGMAMRVGGDNKYKYGFNGKENDNEVKGGDGLQQDYGMRVYDPRLGKFLSIDPIASKYPWYTPYQFAGNKPIQFIDLDGAEEAEITKKYLPYAVDMANAPASYKGVGGNVVKTTYNLHGYAVNYQYFWEKVIGANPDFLDEWNKGRVLVEGRAPVFTHQLKANFEKLGMSTEGLKVGDILHHHHINQGRTAIPITESEHYQIPTQKSGSAKVNKSFGEIAKKASNKVKNATGLLSIFAQISTEVFGLFNGNPDATINQMGNSINVGAITKNVESGTYFNVVSMQKNDLNGTAFFWVYSGYEWDKDAKKFVGTGLIGYGESYQEKGGYSRTIVYDLNGTPKSFNEKGTKQPTDIQ